MVVGIDQDAAKMDSHGVAGFQQRTIPITTTPLRRWAFGSNDQH
jgi:hypothetical protein